MTLRLLFSILIFCEFLFISNAQVKINWANVTVVSISTPTLQVVVNPLLRRGQAVAKGAFDALAALKCDMVRFVPWLPYPRLGVAELEPPTGNPICTDILNLKSGYIECSGGTIQSIDFASYGTPTGSCGNWNLGTCHALNSTKIVSDACLGKSLCLLDVLTSIFGDPCYGTVKHLAVQVTCKPNVPETSWDFTDIDPLVEDFMNATRGHSVIINFSTPPQWMFVTPRPIPYPTDPNQVYWSYEQGTDLRDPSLKELGTYYKNLVSWYTNGGFTDIYGVKHVSNHHYDIPYWEILNEIDFEHSTTPEDYTRRYDAIAEAILQVQPKMKFVGLALALSSHFSYFSYFLNHSNHKSGIPLDYISYHFYASSSSRTNPSDYQTFFEQATSFLGNVRKIQSIREELSPETKTTIDELGVILPDDNDPNAAPIPDVYWNAAGAMYAYLFSELTKLRIEVIGESQLVGYPSQFPSVSMVAWDKGGIGNARYWVLYLLHSYFSVGDEFVQTESGLANVYAQAYLSNGQKYIMVINKTLKVTSIVIPQATNGEFAFVDTPFSPFQKQILKSDTLVLQPFAVGILHFA